ncbi:MAG: LytR C-terminal domain-containing protein, partial [Solirubrobacterales bacterium]|nr:LytR C-terminal domain-containing protein [Solirubrobacterales bacterium]
GRRDGGDEGRSPARATLAVVGAVAVILVALVVIGIQVLGGGGDEPTATKPNQITTPAAQGTDTTGGTSTTGAQPVRRGDVTVSVLNGTTTPGLARGVSNKLQSAGFKIGTVTNALDQSRSATIVEYAEGRRAEAREVARLIEVSSDAIEPLDEGTRVLAGPGAMVVVTVGGDQNTGQQP